jgi:hypothetical protein
MFASLLAQKLPDDGAQDRRLHRLVQHTMSAGAEFAQVVWRGIAGDEEDRYRTLAPAKWLSIGFDGCPQARSPIIGNDQIGLSSLVSGGGNRSGARCDCQDLISPSS